MNIKFTLRSIVIAVAVAAAIFSCAKRSTEDYSETEQFALEAWIAKYAPDAAELGEWGIYYEVLEPAPEGAAALKPEDWFFLDYKIKDTDWNVIYNRDDLTARRVGQFNRYTRYVPDYLAMPEDIADMTIMQGMYYGLMDMKAGEKRRFYIPSKYGYGDRSMQNSYGYGGQKALRANAPLILDDVVITEIVADPRERERNMVEEFVKSWGMNPADSLKNHFYYEILHRDEKGDTIPYGYDVELFYTGRFVEDGAVFDTNIDSVWVNRFGQLRRYDPVTPLTMMRKEDMSATTSMPEITFSYLLPELRYGDSLRVATISDWAYQAQGKPGYRTTNTNPENDAFENAMLLQYLYGGMGMGGMQGPDSEYYDYWYMMQYFMGGNTGSNQVTEPMPEIKLFTPVWFTIVVREPDYSELDPVTK